MNALAQGLAHLAGRALAGIKLSRVTRSVEAGQCLYLKSRHWYADALIYTTNRFLRLPFYVLPEKEWLFWEPAIYDLAYGERVQASAPGQLELPEIRGTVLAALLRSPDHDAKTRLEALVSSVEALERLHGMWVRFPDGGEGRFSHADAIVDNAIRDAAGGETRWFDFETVHGSRRPREWRQADDLRALAFSAAACLPEGELDGAAHAILSAYADRAVLRAFHHIVERTLRQPDMFHFAQTGISGSRNWLWGKVLQAALRVSAL